MQRRLYSRPVLVGGKRDASGRIRVLYAHPIHDAESFCRSILDSTLQDWGMYLTPDEYDDSLCDLIERCLRLESTYDPQRSTNFARYARYILTRRVVDVAPRQWLGRNGNRIAERSAASLEVLAAWKPGLDPVDPREPGDDDPRWGTPNPGIQSERAGQLAWARSVVGLRKAS